MIFDSFILILIYILNDFESVSNVFLCVRRTLPYSKYSGGAQRGQMFRNGGVLAVFIDF
jgi:hypothetical protein